MKKEIINRNNLKLLVINDILNLLYESRSFESSIQEVCNIIPKAYEYPEQVSVKISIEETDFFREDY